MSQLMIQLEAAEVIPERPFTDPAGSLQDLANLQYMIGRLAQIVSQPGAIPPRPRPFVLYATEPDQRYHRVTIAQLRPLLSGAALHVVGFCGHKRLGADRGPVDAIDENLIEEFPQHPHLLSYSTWQLPCGNSCNLVLFSKPQGLAHWAKGSTHAEAVSLSPGYYTHIRLHNGFLPDGLTAPDALTLLRTKYFDFSGGAIWAAVRESSVV